MAEQRLIKIVAVLIEGKQFSSMKTTISRGICALKRGVTTESFIQEFMAERTDQAFECHLRDDNCWATTPIMMLNQDPRRVITYHFKPFVAEELPHVAKDLTPEELDRDLKTLKGWLKWPK